MFGGVFAVISNRIMISISPFIGGSRGGQLGYGPPKILNSNIFCLFNNNK